MGQYHIPVNLDKKEFIDTHKLGAGLKAWEQLANHPGTGAALLVLLFSSNGRGGGDLDAITNWHGPDRKDFRAAGPDLSQEYQDIASRTVGRWAGDRLAIVGDYGEVGDLPDGLNGGDIYSLCRSSGDGAYRDITDDVCKVIEHELNGKFEGEGWKDFVFDCDREKAAAG